MKPDGLRLTPNTRRTMYKVGYFEPGGQYERMRAVMNRYYYDLRLRRSCERMAFTKCQVTQSKARAGAGGPPSNTDASLEIGS